MGNLVTKNQFKEMELNNTGLNDTIDSVVDTPRIQEADKNQNKDAVNVKKTTQLKNNFLSLFSGSSLDPRSPTAFINRTPIIWRNKISPVLKTNEFSELVNDSVLSEVSMEILTKEEEESLPSLKDETSKESSPAQEIDPRSPTVGITRTPLVLEPTKSGNENLLRTVTEKLVSAVIHEKEDKPKEEKENEDTTKQEKAPVASKRVQLIYEDFEDIRFSTPPKSKKLTKNQDNNRTPLGCLANKTPSSKPAFPQINSSTPIKSKNPSLIIFPDENSLAVEMTPSANRNGSRIPIRSARKIH